MGHEQSKRLAEAATRWRLSRLVASPFLRTLETARYVEQATGVVPEVRTALHEKGGCVAGHPPGIVTGRPGMTRSEMARRFPTYRIEPEIDGQGWWGSQPLESLEQAQRRARQLLLQTCAEFQHDDRVAYIMHGDFLMLFVACFHPRPVNLAWNASVSRVVIDRDTARLEDYSCVQHLPNYLVTW
jgi:broad specificity phosphatase PhoE